MIIDNKLIDLQECDSKYFKVRENIVHITDDIFNYFNKAGNHGGYVGNDRIIFYGYDEVTENNYDISEYICKTIYIDRQWDDVNKNNTFISELYNCNYAIWDIQTEIALINNSYFSPSNLDGAVKLLYKSDLIKHHMYNVVTIGYYFPKINCLWLCDLPHNMCGVNLFNDLLWDELKEVLNLDKKNFNNNKEETKNKQKKETEIRAVTIGADPEFEIYNPYGFVSARDVVNGGTSDDIGVDGNDSVCEFRPRSGKNGKELADNLRYLIEDFDNNYTGYKLMVSGDKQAIGSHIHLGLDKFMNIEIALAGYQKDAVYSFITSKMLNTYKDMLDIVYNTNGSARGEYAQDRPFEYKTYGFEYRLTPASVHLIPNVYALYSQSIMSLFNVKTDKDAEDILRIVRPAISYFAEHWNDIKVLSINDVWLNKENIFNLSKKTIKPSFRDSWDSLSQSRLRMIMDSYPIESYFNVCFYGLKKQRGIIFSPPDISSELMPKPLYDYNNMTIYIGVPYVFRMGIADIIDDESRNSWSQKIYNILKEVVVEVDNRFENNYLTRQHNVKEIIDMSSELSDKAYDKLISAYY